ncbi:RBBP9/YdeN family alpha/beta hydrolase [Undibacterium sp. SXout7W]|uniref:RBBP9/YdeN family alpha/beta hydrolase n=1 Tax=Undibacterium sp. SXout7W TaxID=3413049 RepID=UPI003BF2E9F9
MLPYYTDFDFIIQPGWNNSGPDHWQTHWQQALDARRVSNHSWDQPQLEDWLRQLDILVDASTRPVIVIAHSLGCATVAHYDARYPDKLAGALLVAPADVERPFVPAALQSFAPLPRKALSIPVRMIASTNDPFSTVSRTKRMAQIWQAPPVWLDNAGHINVASGHTQWQSGFTQLDALLNAVHFLKQQEQSQALWRIQ